MAARLHGLILILAFASGICGIAYELIYARLLTTHFGDMFYVAAAILSTFLLGIAAGSFVAHRWVRWLWLIELAIGAYAAAIALAFSLYSVDVMEAFLPVTSGNPPALVAVVFVLLFVPALLIGFSVPLFALIKRHADSGIEKARSFRTVYETYNLGAAFCVLLIEFVVLRTVGIVGTLYAVAAVNLATSLLLLRVATPETAGERPFANARERFRESAPQLAALFAASVASGVYQLYFYQLAGTLFGPFHENFALVLVLALLGIALGTAVVDHYGVPLDRWLLAGALCLALSFLLLSPLIHLWANLNGALGALPAASKILKVVVLALLGGAPFAVFGGTIPALLGELRFAPGTAGVALAVSSVGNACGYLATVLWLYATFSDRVISLLIGAALVAAGLALALTRRRRPPRLAAAGAAALAVAAVLWPSALLFYSHVDYSSARLLRAAKESFSSFDVHREFSSQLSLLQRDDGSEALIINGYPSLVTSAGGLPNIRETLFGVTAAVYTPRRDSALVLGVGTGITAGATASVYRRTTAVEVDPAVLAVLPRFDAYNLGLRSNPGVEIVLEDGLAALLAGGERYDAIINTVTSPLYFSSSKLYTRDFFALIRRHLAPGGVYAMWFDGRVQEEGARIIYRSLRQSFADCHVTYLAELYLQVLCAGEPMTARPPAEWPREVLEVVDAYRFGLDLNGILRALLFSRHRLFATEWDAPANTFDLPSLEFLMASRGGESRGGWSPYELMGLDFTSSPLAAAPLAGLDLATRCYLMRRLSIRRVSSCLDVLLADSDPTALEEFALHVHPWLSTRELFEMTVHLTERERLDAAWQLIRSRQPRLAERDAAIQLAARIRLRRGESLDDADLAVLYGSGPVDPAVRALLTAGLAERGDMEQALLHQAFMQQLGLPPSAGARGRAAAGPLAPDAAPDAPPAGDGGGP